MDLSSLGKGAVTRVVFRSTVTPPFEYNPWQGGGDQKAPPSPIMSFVKPAVVVDTAAGPMTFAPYGEPKRNLFPLVVVGGVLLVVGAVYAIAWIARKTAR